MHLSEISSLTLESAAAFILLIAAYKIYKMRCASHSKCCGDQLEMTSFNPGAP